MHALGNRIVDSPIVDERDQTAIALFIIAGERALFAIGLNTTISERNVSNVADIIVTVGSCHGIVSLKNFHGIMWIGSCCF